MMSLGATRPLLSPGSHTQFLDEPPGAAMGWTCHQVGQWLESLSLEQYVEEFSAHGIDGPRLLHLDGAKLKVGNLRVPTPLGGFRDA